MTERFTCEVIDTDLWHVETITDNFEMNSFDDVETVTELLNKFSEENNELKQLIDLFAQDICDLTEILSKNQLDYELHSDVENFIIKWGIRIE